MYFTNLKNRFYFFSCIFDPVYTNALLATLNARKMITEKADLSTTDKVSLSLRELSKNGTANSRAVGLSLLSTQKVDFLKS